MFVGAIAAVASSVDDFTLGELVERTRPISGATASSYPRPSFRRHGPIWVFGALAVPSPIATRVLCPDLHAAWAFSGSRGATRIHEGDHWPSDVAAAYLLPGILLMIIVPLYRWYAETGFG